MGWCVGVRCGPCAPARVSQPSSSGAVFLFVYFIKVLRLPSQFSSWVSSPSECSFLFKSRRRVLLGSGLQKLGTGVQGSERLFVPLRPREEFANTCGTYKPWMQRCVTLSWRSIESAIRYLWSASSEFTKLEI